MLTIANHKIHSNVKYILDSRFGRCSFSFAYFYVVSSACVLLIFLNSWLLFHIYRFNVIQKAQINVFAMPFTEFEFTFSFWYCRCFVFEFYFIWYCCFGCNKMESKTFSRNHHSFGFPWFCILISLPHLNFVRWHIFSLLLCLLFVAYRLTIFKPCMNFHENDLILL